VIKIWQLRGKSFEKIINDGVLILAPDSQHRLPSVQKHRSILKILLTDSQEGFCTVNSIFIKRTVASKFFPVSELAEQGKTGASRRHDVLTNSLTLMAKD
jgi:hypothetical protein